MNLLDKFTVDYYGARCFRRSYKWLQIDFDFNPNGHGGGCHHVSFGRERRKYCRPWGIGLDWDAYFGEPNRLYFHCPWGFGSLNLPDHRGFIETGQRPDGVKLVRLEKVSWHIDRPLLHWTWKREDEHGWD